MNGKVCVVTGATSGIGKAAATALARMGSQVVLAGRDRGRAEATAAEIGAVAAVPPKVEIADLASMEQVRALAGRLASLERIDVLVNNAGLVLGERRVTEDGFEHVLAVNHLAPFLLTNLLLPRLQASAPSRIVTVASRAHRGQRIDLAELPRPRHWRMSEAYGRSKLCNILFTRELAARLDPGNTVAACLHPGVVATDIGKRGGVFELAWRLGSLFMLRPEQGADTSVFLATTPDPKPFHGAYVVKRQTEAPDPAALDADLARHLWDARARLVGL